MRKRIRVLVLCWFVIVLWGCAMQTDVKNKETESFRQDADITQADTGGWRITEYGSVTGSQSMFYTIEDAEKNLVIIDGGYDSDAAQVREIIEEHNNHVKAWIVTHPHPDHAGAFNEIMASPDGITVEAVYTVEVHKEAYQDTAQDYDRIDVYEEFERVMAGLPALHYVHENDVFELLGLKVKVLHAWNDETDELDSNLCNNGSMVFVISGKEERMLFCADMESDVQEAVIEGHGEELDVDYVQLGHHGNWGPTKEFYEYMSPKAVFFDCPDNILNTENNIYDAYMLRDYFLEKGVKVYSFSTAPNVITIK